MNLFGETIALDICHALLVPALLHVYPVSCTHTSLQTLPCGDYKAGHTILLNVKGFSVT